MVHAVDIHLGQYLIDPRVNDEPLAINNKLKIRRVKNTSG
jgi:hypothetical protein